VATSETQWTVLVPAYREADHIADVVRGILRRAPRVLVVDDGSDDATAVRAEEAGAQVVRHAVNRGKGAAVHTGLRHARGAGLEFVIVMDADGQHDPDEIPAFVDTYRRTGCPVLVGNRMADPRGMPLLRRLTNRVMSALLSRKMGQRVPDTQNGFRLYRLDTMPEEPPGAQRFAAESEILLDLAARGVRIGAVPTRVIYGDETSKINPVRDTVRFFGMLRAWDKRRRTDAVKE
jgi:glycosyltransferase involved in cell wall biosynthesis